VTKPRKGKVRLGKGRKSWAKIRAAARLAEFWGRRWAERKERWQANPELKDPEMEKIFKTIKDRARARRETLVYFARQLPEQIKSADINATLFSVAEMLGHKTGRKDIHARKVALVRHGLIAFDNVSLLWRVAKI
jgi:hypothetical protein